MDENVPEPPGVVAGLTYDERVEEFLRLLSEGNRVRHAASAVAISYATLYRKRREDPELAKRWEDALRISVKPLENEAYRRALAGSDKLLIFMLQSMAPEKYGEKQRLELTNPDGSLAPQSEEGRAARVEAILATARARKAAKAIEDLL